MNKGMIYWPTVSVSHSRKHSNYSQTSDSRTFNNRSSRISTTVPPTLLENDLEDDSAVPRPERSSENLYFDHQPLRSSIPQVSYNTKSGHQRSFSTTFRGHSEHQTIISAVSSVTRSSQCLTAEYRSTVSAHSRYHDLNFTSKTQSNQSIGPSFDRGGNDRPKVLLPLSRNYLHNYHNTSQMDPSEALRRAYLHGREGAESFVSFPGHRRTSGRRKRYFEGAGSPSHHYDEQQDGGRFPSSCFPSSYWRQVFCCE